MRSFRSAIRDVDQEPIAELLPLGLVRSENGCAVRVVEKVSPNAIAEQRLGIVWVAAGRPDDAARERIANCVCTVADYRSRAAASSNRITSRYAGIDVGEDRSGVAVNRVVIGAGVPSDIVRQPEDAIAGVDDGLLFDLVSGAKPRGELRPVRANAAAISIGRRLH